MSCPCGLSQERVLEVAEKHGVPLVIRGKCQKADGGSEGMTVDHIYSCKEGERTVSRLILHNKGFSSGISTERCNSTVRIIYGGTMKNNDQ